MKKSNEYNKLKKMLVSLKNTTTSFILMILFYLYSKFTSESVEEMMKELKNDETD